MWLLGMDLGTSGWGVWGVGGVKTSLCQHEPVDQEVSSPQGGA